LDILGGPGNRRILEGDRGIRFSRRIHSAVITWSYLPLVKPRFEIRRSLRNGVPDGLYWLLGALVLLTLVTGCARRGPSGLPRLEFPRDTLAITNETQWVYGQDPTTGKQVHVVRDPPPTYSLRCFVLSRTVKLFHAHAEFAPFAPPLDESAYRACIREVVKRSPRRASEPGKRVVIPGYAGLYAFSEAWPRLFQEESGAAWESYVQRGHWRMIFPFSRKHQRREVLALAEGVRDGRSPVVHVVDFPGLKINHALVLLEVVESRGDYQFQVYDPNTPGRPVELRFDRSRGQFVLGSVPYFIGGDVAVYEVYCGWLK